jgi:hypothetical protein
VVVLELATTPGEVPNDSPDDEPEDEHPEDEELESDRVDESSMAAKPHRANR